MIFTGFKRNSNQLFFKRRFPELLKNATKFSSQKVTRILVFLDDFSNKKAINENLYKLLNMPAGTIEILVFHTKIDENGDVQDKISSADFGWYGKIKSEKLKNILTKKYDLLINYSKVDNIYINLLILQCKAAFRVGFSHLDNRFYDLIINCESSNFILFNEEMKKYLQILKKI
jgi:hypothetical protein